MIAANDGGVDVSTDGGETWYAPPLPIAQFYHVSADNSVPYRVIGRDAGPRHRLGAEQQPVARPASRTGDWYTVGGGEAGHAVADPTDPNIVYAGEYLGIITRYDHRTRQARNVDRLTRQPLGPRRRRSRATASSGRRRSRSRPTTRRPSTTAATCSSARRTAARRWTRDQPRPDAQRQDEAALVRRADHRRQHRRRVLLHDLRDRRVAAREGPPLGRQRRRARPRHARRRQDAGRT